MSNLPGRGYPKMQASLPALLLALGAAVVACGDENGAALAPDGVSSSGGAQGGGNGGPNSVLQPDAAASTPATHVKSTLSQLCFGGAKVAGTVVTQGACDDGVALPFVERALTVEGASYAQLQVRGTELCLELPAGTSALEARAALGACDANPATSAPYQLFRFDADRTHTHIVAKHSALCLNVDQSSLAAGAEIQQWTCGEYPNQYFELASVAPPTELPPAPAGETTAVTFAGSDAELPNPERGFYCFGEDLASTSAGTLSACRDQGHRLVFAPTQMKDFRTSDLSPAYLASLTAGFATYRAQGMKTVLRFTYNYDGGGADASVAQVQRHLQQLAPILSANADVIGFVQAGLVGAWGEWHDSASGLTSDANKDAIRAALMAAVPSAFPVSFRYPSDLVRWSASPIAAAQAFDGSAESRSGFHNDCFMSSDNDVGTYSNNATTRASQRDYAAATTAFAPFGGETCSGFGPERKSCNDILGEGADFHLAYLNAGFYTAFHDQWRAEGCFDTVRRTMGYRFQLDGAKVPVKAQRGTSIGLDVDVRNVGWSRIFSARKIVAVLRSRDTGAELLGSSTADLRTLPPQATASTTLTVSIGVPAEAAAGAYDVALAIPDVYPSTQADARFAVRPANADDAGKGQAWDETQARFTTGATVQVE